MKQNPEFVSGLRHREVNRFSTATRRSFRRRPAIGRLVAALTFLSALDAVGAGRANWLDGEPTHDSRFMAILPEIGDYPVPVRNALAAGLALGRNNWAWTERMVVGNTETVSRWDPSQPRDRKIVLLEKNGQPAAESDQEKYFQRQDDELDSSAEEQPSMSRRMAAVAAAMRFLPVGKSDEGMHFALSFDKPDYSGLGWLDRMFVRVVTQVRGIVVVDEDVPGFVRVEIANPDPIGLMPGVKLRVLEVKIDSEFFPEARTWLPVSMSVRVDGGFWLFGSIARSVDFAFGEYANVGLPPRDPLDVLADIDEYQNR